MHTASRISKVLIVVVAVSMLFAGDAFANYRANTRLTIDAPRHVQAGHAFTISGTLKSRKHFCRANSKIELIRHGDGVVGHDRTTSRGHYAFRTRIHDTSKFSTKFEGKARGVHPNQRVCERSTSRTKRVRVS
jgi:hypothetical protein